MLTPKEAIETLNTYEAAWKPHEEKILTGMCEAFDLEFYLPVVDLFVNPRMPSFSTPLIINTRNEPDAFIDTLAHELLHILLSDSRQKFKLGPAQEKLFPDEDLMTRNHIFVHAGHQYIYLDVLKQPERLERDKANVAHNPPYKRAWEIVEQDGYKELIEKLKSCY